MIRFTVTKDELEKALAMLKDCEDKGFAYSKAVFALTQVGRSLGEDTSEFDDRVILKKHPTDGRGNYGNVSKLELEWMDQEEIRGM